MIKNLFSLAKPGIIFGNLITALGGFFLASKGEINYIKLILTLVGISSVIGSGCVFNNIIDQDIDRLMDRTRNRVLVRGLVSVKIAFIYAVFLGTMGIAILAIGSNLLTTLIACLGLFVYVVIYSLWLKRSSVYGTLIGSISGAIPPVVGYCSVTNRFDSGALILFLILSIWQMPHSYAIAIYRFNDYAKANIPVLPVKNGIAIAKIHTFLYVIGFLVTSLMLTIFHYTGYVYFVVVLVLGIMWLRLCILGFSTQDDKVWARKTFTFSVICLTILSLTMSIDFIR